MAALALLALVAAQMLVRLRGRRARVEATPLRDRPADAAASVLRLEPMAGGAFLAERFETRRRTAGQRLSAILRALRHADPQMAKESLAEAESIAHVLAGTAGMFGETGLANAARRTEAEIKLARRGAGESDPAPAIQRLIAALDAPVQRPDSDQRLRA